MNVLTVPPDHKAQGSTMTHSFQVEGMTCNSCVSKVKAAIELHPDVLNAEVTLVPPNAAVTMRSRISNAALNELLVKAGNYSLNESTAVAPTEMRSPGVRTYFPLFLIGGYLLGGVLLREISLSRFEMNAMMSNFMGGFFVLFSFFKLLDLKGFAEGYRTYDILAQKWPMYGYVYPGIELGLGISYLMTQSLMITNVLTIIIMGVSSVGVIQALLQKRAIQCACLGTFFKLPLTNVTLFEDLLMAGMSALMLYSAR